MWRLMPAMKHSILPRPTVGVLISSMAEKVQTYMWHGMVDAAEAEDVNLICVAGRSLQAPFADEKIHNKLYDLAQLKELDGMLLVSGCIANFISIEEYTGFLERFEAIPKVSLHLALQGIPSVSADNSSGLREAIIHLYRKHGARRIAMIKGPEEHQEAIERFRTYRRTLEELGLLYDPNLVVSGNFSNLSVPSAISELLDQRKAEFDALCVANDEMAGAAVELLQQRGFRVPEDVCVIGFDDSDVAISSAPPLTTVHQPLYELGYQGMEILAAKLKGESVPEHTVLPTRLVVRRSCGCYSQAIQEVKPLFPVSQSVEAKGSFHDDVLPKLIEKTKTGELMLEEEKVVFLAQSLYNDVLSQKESFIKELSLTVCHRECFGIWNTLLSELRFLLAPILETEQILFMECLIQKARILLGEEVKEAELRRRILIEKQSNLLSENNHGLMKVFDFDKLREVLNSTLRMLSIPYCYIVLLGRSDEEESRLIVACGTDFEFRKELRFPSNQWIPEELAPVGWRFAHIVKALHYQDEMLGYVIFGLGPREGTVYEALAGQISTAVMSILLSEARDLSQTALSESQRTLSTLMSNLPGMAYRCLNDPDWTMLFVSEGCQLLTGYSSRVLLEEKPAYVELILPEDRELTATVIREALTVNKPFQINYRIITAQGETRWVWEQGRAVFDDEGNVEALEGLIIDISEQRRVEEELTASMERLRQSLESTLTAMALTVEIRDPYTAGHQRRVTQLAQALAVEMGLPETQSYHLRLAAGVHDLGKIRIPAEILSKPGKMTPIEYRLIQTHPEVGYDILRTMAFPWPIERIVLQHHERMDGSGYPYGLKGDEILLEARILAVADVVEAMSSHRPYRPALGVDRALLEINDHKGQLYDEKVVEACLAVFKKGFAFAADA